MTADHAVPRGPTDGRGARLRRKDTAAARRGPGPASPASPAARNVVAAPLPPTCLAAPTLGQAARPQSSAQLISADTTRMDGLLNWPDKWSEWQRQ